MSVLWKKIEFYKGKGSDCNRKLGLWQSPGGVSGGQAQKTCLVNVFGRLTGKKNYIHGLRSYTSL